MYPLDSEEFVHQICTKLKPEPTSKFHNVKKKELLAVDKLKPLNHLEAFFHHTIQEQIQSYTLKVLTQLIGITKTRIARAMKQIQIKNCESARFWGKLPDSNSNIAMNVPHVKSGGRLSSSRVLPSMRLSNCVGNLSHGMKAAPTSTSQQPMNSEFLIPSVGAHRT